MRSNWSDPEIESALLATLRPAAVPVGAADRMIAALPARIPALSWWRQRPVRYALAIVAASLALIFAASPAAQAALVKLIQQVFYYIPGQGIRGVSPQTLILPQPASLTRDGITFRVVSVLASEQSVVIAYEVTGLPGGKDEKVGSPDGNPYPAYLVDGRGHHYDLHSQSFGEGGSTAENHVSGDMGFDPLAASIRDVTLVAQSATLAIPTRLAAGLGAWHLELHLETPTEAALTPADLTTHAMTVHGITLHLDQVETPPGGIIAHVSGWSRSGMRVDGLDVPAPVSLLSGIGQGGAWDLSIPTGTTTLRVDRVHATIVGSAATVNLNVPRRGSVAIDLRVHLGGYTVVLNREKWVDDQNGHNLRIYFTPAAAVDGARIEHWRMDGVNSYEIVWIDGGPGGYLELPNPAPGRAVLHFKDPGVLIDGPWVLSLTTS